MHPLRPRAWVLERPRHLKAEEAHALLSDPRLRALLVSGRLWTGVHQQIPQHHTAEWWDTHTLLAGTRPPTCRKLFTSANSDHHRDSNRNSSRASRFLVQERLFRVPTPLLQGCSHLAPKTWDLPYGETILKLSSHCESPDIMAEMHERSRKHSILWLAIISSIGPSKLVWGLHLKIPANSNPAPTPASTGPLLTMPD